MNNHIINISRLALYFTEKTCFTDFSAKIFPGQGIGIIGDNGSGKSALLHIIAGLSEPSDGEIRRHKSLALAFVPQQPAPEAKLSGSQRFNQALSQALAQNPEVLILDEPTNHLDLKNRNALLSMLKNFSGTLIIASHDTELLEICASEIWHLDQARVNIFRGLYSDYLAHITQERFKLESELKRLNRQKLAVHESLMREQERAKKKRLHGEKKYDGDKLALRSAQGRGQATANKNRKNLAQNKDEVLGQLAGLYQPEEIRLKFAINPADLSSTKPVLAIKNGACGYRSESSSNISIISNINLQINSGQRLAILGNNGSGKSTLVKAIIAWDNIWRSGTWIAPEVPNIGYLDQHYATLDPKRTPYEIIHNCAPSWTVKEIRQHLNDFLFRKNEQVNTAVKFLSGGEQARLSLACIAALRPKLLILDEITNNLDIKTKEHIIQILEAYTGALLVISHDYYFLERIKALDLILRL